MTDPRLAWSIYYEIIGAGGAALIAIQFVVMTLIAYMRRPPDEGAVSAFGTPIVVHLSVALVIAASISAPVPLLLPTLILGFCGFAGFAYGCLIFRRAYRQTAYKPVLEDWIWYGVVPSLLYAALAVGALLLPGQSAVALPVIAGVALGFLLVGIRNSWDSVTHIVITEGVNVQRE